MKPARAKLITVDSETSGEPVSPVEMPAEFDAETFYLKRLEQARWPDGLQCIREGCDSRRVMTFDVKGKTGKMRHLYECVDCRYQYSVTTGTIFHNSHLPLQKWFLAIQMFSTATNGVSARDFARKLNINYRTAEYVIRRIRQAMRPEVD
jgi:transposase-like protein